MRIIHPKGSGVGCDGGRCLPVGRNGKCAALPARVGSVAVGKGVMPVHLSKASRISSLKIRPQDKGT